MKQINSFMNFMIRHFNLMKKALMLLVLIIRVGYSANCQNTNHERVLQIQTIENGDSFLLIQKSIGNAELNTSSFLDSFLVFIRHKPFKGDINIIILDTILGNNGRRQGRLLNKEYQINELYIKFIDSNVGFFLWKLLELYVNSLYT